MRRADRLFQIIQILRAWRYFRIDRIARIEFLAERYPQEPGRCLVDYLAANR